MAEVITSAYAQPAQLASPVTATIADQDSTATTIAVASNGVVLPFVAGTLNVAATAGFAASGTLVVYPASGVPTLVTYTGIGSATTFTGCNGGTGTLATGGAVQAGRIVTFAAAYYRMLLTPTGAAGTSALVPKETLAYVQSILRGGNSRWFVTMLTTARVRIRYNGTGLAVIFLPGEVQCLLGFATSTIGPVFVGSTGDDYKTATNTPTHFMAICSRMNDANWQDTAAGSAGSILPDGTVVMNQDGYALLLRSYTLARLPRTATDATALSSNVTPMWPDDTSTTRRKQPTATLGTTAIQWSVHEFLYTAVSVPLGVAHGNFQAIIAATSTTYDICYLTPKTREGKAQPSTMYWSARADRAGVELSLYDGNGSTL